MENEPLSVAPDQLIDTPIAPPPVPGWSERAMRRLSAAQIAGAIMIVAGSLLLVVRIVQQEFVAAALLSEASLYLVPFGVVLLALTRRTRAAAPDAEYQPRSIVQPRTYFILIWLAGTVVTLALSGLAATDYEPSFGLPQIVRVALAATLYVVGGVWVFRWVSGKVKLAWPSAEPDQPVTVAARWPRAWLVGWAGLWGAASIVLSDLLLVVLNVLLDPTALTVSTQFSEPDEALNAIFSMLEEPGVAVAAVLAAVLMLVLFAPLVEEAMKSFGLRLMRRRIVSANDGLLLGLAAGLGFGVLESGLYLYTIDSWLLGAWLRLGTALMHGVATSLVGLAYVRSLRSGRRRDLFAGYLRAVALHGLWNGTVVLVIAGLGFLTLVPCVSAVIALGALVLMVMLLARVLPRTVAAGAQTVVQEDYRHAQEPLPPAWRPGTYHIGWRFVGNEPEYPPIHFPVAVPTPIEPPLDPDFQV